MSRYEISEARRRDFASILEMRHWRVLSYSVALLAPPTLLLLLWPRLATNLFATSVGEQTFLPHGVCYLWVPHLWLMHLSTDLVIGLSYVAISLTLVYLIHRARRDIPFHWVFLAFGLFIIASGATLFMEVWTIWHPTYWLSGYVTLMTAAVSAATAVVLPPLVPKVLMLIQAVKLSEERKAQLETTHGELAEARYAALERISSQRVS